MVASKIKFDDNLLTKLKHSFSIINSRFFDFLLETMQTFTSKHLLPGPTGESNELSYHAKGCVLCLGPTPNDALEQAIMSLALGNSVIALLSEKDHSSLVGLGFAEKSIARIEKGPSSELLASDKYHAIFYFGDAMSVESELMNRQDIVPVIDSIFEPWRLVNERVVTIDTTASGGNANLLAL